MTEHAVHLRPATLADFRQVTRDNRPALRLYRALGWRPHRLPLPRGLCYMVLDLSGRRAG